MMLSLRATRLSSLNTPATDSCKEKLLIAMHISILIALLDQWEQNILVLDEEWVEHLMEFFHHWHCGKKCLIRYNAE
jgi:hypothetical protein